jgi:hypothetical protein
MQGRTEYYQARVKWSYECIKSKRTILFSLPQIRAPGDPDVLHALRALPRSLVALFMHGAHAQNRIKGELSADGVAKVETPKTVQVD